MRKVVSLTMAFNFTGKTIVVTGAGQGIGRAIAVALSISGCKVYAVSRTKSTLDSLVEERPDIIPITQDLQDWEGTKATLEQIDAPDGLVNNAGQGFGMYPALDYPKEKLDLQIQNNLYSVINCTQVIAKKMIAAGKSGSIVNNSSIMSTAAVKGVFGYSVVKAAMDMVTKQFALELGPHNIRVNSVNPTIVWTDKMKVMSQATSFTALFEERTAMKRLPEVQDCVSPVLYLLSDYSTMVTGTLHLIDAGTSCNITTKQ